MWDSALMVEMYVAPTLATASFTSFSEQSAVASDAGTPGIGGLDPLTETLSAMSTAMVETDDASVGEGLLEQTAAGGTGLQNVASFVATDDSGASSLSDPGVGPGTVSI